jgi:hypothetical protein
MVDGFRIVTFDTSAHNRLVEDGPRAEPLLAGLKSELFFRFSGLSVGELLACPDAAKRAALFASCQRLQGGQSDCLYPHNELVRLLIVDHLKNSAVFDWKTVDVRAPGYEQGIREGRFFGNQQLSADQNKEQSEQKKAYKKVFAKPREELERVFAAYREAQPATFKQAIAQTSLRWRMGKWLYDRAANTDVSEATIKEFMAACPPFHAMIYALLMSYYDISLRDRQIGEEFTAGRNDLFMSVCLPYCHKFITADREQEKCLREVAAVAGLETEILSYDDFRDSFLVTT